MSTKRRSGWSIKIDVGGLYLHPHPHPKRALATLQLGLGCALMPLVLGFTIVNAISPKSD